MEERIEAEPRIVLPDEAPRVLCRVENLKVHIPITKGLMKHRIGTVKAVDGVSFAIEEGETFGVVGEAGSGKTTLGNCLLLREKYTDGSFEYDGRNQRDLSRAEIRGEQRARQKINNQAFFALDQTLNVQELITEEVRMDRTLSRIQLEELAEEMMEIVGLYPDIRYHDAAQLTLEQKQRVALARAIAKKPKFFICDEVVSGLDPALQAGMLLSIGQAKEQLGLTCVYIGASLSVARHVCDHVAVMYLGKLMEVADGETIYHAPKHPYTKALIATAMMFDDGAQPEESILHGEMPSAMEPPIGCRFCTRCPHADKRCFREEPEFQEIAYHHFVACHKVTPDTTSFP